MHLVMKRKDDCLKCLQACCLNNNITWADSTEIHLTVFLEKNLVTPKFTCAASLSITYPQQ